MTELVITDWNDVHVAFGLDAVREQIIAQLRDDVARSPAPAVPPPVQVDIAAQFLRGKSGPLNTMRNVALILQHHADFVGSLAYCEFSYRIIKRKRLPFPSSKAGEWIDNDSLNMKNWIGDQYGFAPSVGEINEAVMMVASDAAFHPVREYLQALHWDGHARLSHWLRDVLEAAGDSVYLDTVGTKFLIGAVARVMRPPVKMDNVLILEGLQGIGKSTLVRMLFNGFYSESPLDLGSKDSFQQIQGVWGVELPELDSFNKAESTSAKAFFSQLKDRFRPPYGRATQEFARQCVFIGTTNQDEYLKDYSGNRRYWPVNCGAVNLCGFEAYRDQLWAEAFARFNAGEGWWLSASEQDMFSVEQDLRMLRDPWEGFVVDWLEAPEQLFKDEFRAEEIILGACGRDRGHSMKADQMRLSPIMKSLGWVRRKSSTTIGDHYRPMVYVRPVRRSPDGF